MAPFGNPELTMWHKEHGRDLRNEALDLAEKPSSKKGESEDVDVTPQDKVDAGKIIRRRPSTEKSALN